MHEIHLLASTRQVCAMHAFTSSSDSAPPQSGQDGGAEGGARAGTDVAEKISAEELVERAV